VPIPTPGLAIGRREQTMGIRACSHAQLHLDRVTIPRENLLGELGHGFRIAMTALDVGRIGMAAQAVGIGQAAFEAALAYAKERTAFGAPIAAMQAIQFKLADMATRLQAARLLTWQAAVAADRREPLTAASAMAKLVASEMATFVAHQAIQIFGGNGYSMEFPVERHYRDARITEIYEGTSEVLRGVIANRLLK
jgi:butyryl-CoA dehydrogenase